MSKSTAARRPRQPEPARGTCRLTAVTHRGRVALKPAEGGYLATADGGRTCVISDPWFLAERLYVAITSETQRGPVSKTYTLSRVDADRPAYELDGRDEMTGAGEVYHVAATDHGPACDCGDATFRRPHARTREAAACKHVRALVALKLLPE